jgi:hypothetical protein
MVHVLRKGTGMRELLPALVALEGFLAGVEPTMLGEVMLVLERFPANVTLERPHT